MSTEEEKIAEARAAVRTSAEALARAKLDLLEHKETSRQFDAGNAPVAVRAAYYEAYSQVKVRLQQEVLLARILVIEAKYDFLLLVK